MSAVRLVAFAMKKFKSHQRVGEIAEIVEAIKLEEQREMACSTQVDMLFGNSCTIHSQTFDKSGIGLMSHLILTKQIYRQKTLPRLCSIMFTNTTGCLNTLSVIQTLCSSTFWT